MNSDFWRKLDSLVAGSVVKIDRPRGTSHPRYPSYIYPLDYGYLEGTQSGDGAGIDVWVGSLPSVGVTGAIVCVDVEKRDAEVKALLGCTREEMEAVCALQNSGGQAGMLLVRGD